MGASGAYRTLATAVEVEFKRVDSRFIGRAYPVEGCEDVAARLEQARARYPDATHHCWAHRLLLDGEPLEACDDDGEPLNSAGPPMLRVLQGRALWNALVIVVRYFGGTKLGVGGLVRAYGDAAQAALDAARVVTRVPQVRLRVRYPHGLTGAVMGAFHRLGVDVEGFSYDERAEAVVQLPRAERAALERALQEAGAGRVEVRDD